ncbi:T9SS type A sorting domain-containing protein [candidate division KSB1 bacterium]|nr:T9SS type A sorting domain-containing protein [candidate division KSB1 bacterium]
MNRWVMILLTVASTLAYGTPLQWDEPGITVRTGTFLRSEGSVSRADGTTLLIWTDARRGDRDVWVQMLSPQGQPLWTPGGVCLSGASGVTDDRPVAADVGDGWVLSWGGSTDTHWGGIWSQKISDAGALVWGAEPVHIFDNTSPANIRLAKAQAGGAFLVWTDNWSSGQILAQHVNSIGTLWPEPLAISPAGSYAELGSLVSDLSGNVLIGWNTVSGNPNPGDPRVTKLTADGQFPWGESGVALEQSPGYEFGVQLTPDAFGGAYAIWSGDRGLAEPHILAQRLNSNGEAQWAVGGVPVCAAEQLSSRYVPRATALSIMMDSFDGLLVAWTDTRATQYASELWAQKLSGDGVPQWATDGLRVCGDGEAGEWAHDRWDPALSSDGLGGAVLCWTDVRENWDWANTQLYAARLDGAGEFVWGDGCGIPLATLPGQQQESSLVLQGDRLLAAWEDVQAPLESVRIQRLSVSDGEREFAEAGLVMTGGNVGEPMNVSAATLGGHHVALFWSDTRGQSFQPQPYYAVVDSSGEQLGPVDGARIAPGLELAYGTYHAPSACLDGDGGAFALWSAISESGDARYYLSHIDQNGNLLSDPAGTPVWHEPGFYDQILGACISDGAGGCFVAWSGFDQDFALDVYVMRMSSTCYPVWAAPVRLWRGVTPDDYLGGLVSTPDGCIAYWTSGATAEHNISAAKLLRDGTVAWDRDVCDAVNQQNEPLAVTDYAGGAYFVWQDHRIVGQSDIFLQHLANDGTDYLADNGIHVPGVSVGTSIHPALAVTTAGHLYVAWEDFRGGEQTRAYAQKLTSAAEPLWESAGRALGPVTADLSGGTLRISADDAHGLLAVWSAFTGESVDLLGEYFDAAGNPKSNFWQNHDAVIAGGPFYQHGPVLVPDGTHGFVVAYLHEYIADDDNTRCLRVQRILDGDVWSAGDHRNFANEFSLEQNYPNPFNPSTEISFTIPQSGYVTLEIFDLLGRSVTTLVNESLTAGHHTRLFDAASLPTGVYLYRLQSAGLSSVKKLILLR